MLTKHLCGVNTGHRRGFVFQSEASPHYLLLLFHTPFFCIIDGKRVEGDAGDMVLHRPGSNIAHGPLGDGKQFINDWIYFSDDDDDVIKSLPLQFDTILSPDEPQIAGELISSIIEESVKSDEFSARLISDTIYRLLSFVCRSSQKKRDEEKSALANFKAARVHILQNYADEWTLEKMAELTGYSISRFCALYTEFFGVSPINDLLNERLENAKQLLSLHVYKIGDVAQMCGFSSIHYFSGFIKRRTGKSPGEF